MNDIPFTNTELILKQLDISQLNELGQAAMFHVFTGYLDRDQFSDEQIQKWNVEQKEWSRFDWHFDPNPYRRYAGDVTLPRARYYTIAKQPSGTDNGTLVRELRAYYNARESGIVQIRDSTEPQDAQFLSKIVQLDSPHMVLLFLPHGGKPNSFASKFTNQSKTGLMVLLPLKVSIVRLSRIIDVRQPATAEWLANTLPQAEWDIAGKKMKCFAMRPPLDSFKQLLPTLLEQCLGGAGFTNLVGIWLRKLGAEGFVFPSARVDVSVEVRDGHFISSDGFCFVDYSDASVPAIDAIFDLAPGWPSQIQATPEGPGESRTPLVFGNVQINYEDTGSLRGSWHVKGLRKMRELIWRISMLGAVIEALPLSDGIELNKTIVGWLLFGGLEVDLAGAICQLLQEGLMGIPGQIENLRRLIDDVKLRGTPELFNCLQKLYEAAQRQGAIEAE